MSRKVLLTKTGRARQVSEVADPEDVAVLSFISILNSRGLERRLVG
jgi:hypothetical protein